MIGALFGAISLGVNVVVGAASLAVTAAKVAGGVGKAVYKGSKTAYRVGKGLSKGVIRTIRRSRELARGVKSSQIFTKPTDTKATKVNDIVKQSREKSNAQNEKVEESHIFTKPKTTPKTKSKKLVTKAFNSGIRQITKKKK